MSYRPGLIINGQLRSPRNITDQINKRHRLTFLYLHSCTLWLGIIITWTGCWNPLHSQSNSRLLSFLLTGHKRICWSLYSLQSNKFSKKLILTLFTERKLVRIHLLDKYEVTLKHARLIVVIQIKAKFEFTSFLMYLL